MQQQADTTPSGSYPLLSSVPVPPVIMPADQRRGDAQALAADRAAALHADRALREGTTGTLPAPSPRGAATAVGTPPPTFRRAPSQTTAIQPPGVSIRLAALPFAADSAELGAEDRRKLREAADAILAQDGKVRVVGRADGAGAAEAPSMPLARAQAAADELARLGVPAERMSVETTAAARGAAGGGQPAGVEIYLDY